MEITLKKICVAYLLRTFFKIEATSFGCNGLMNVGSSTLTNGIAITGTYSPLQKVRRHTCTYGQADEERQQYRWMRRENSLFFHRVVQIYFKKMEYIYRLPFLVLEVPNLKLKKPSWFVKPSAMIVFSFILLSYFLVTGGQH